MPPEFPMILAACIGLMLVSAWVHGDDDRRLRNPSRVGPVPGGTGILVATTFRAAILAAVPMVLLPVAVAVAWWIGPWS